MSKVREILSNLFVEGGKFEQQCDVGKWDKDTDKALSGLKSLEPSVEEVLKDIIPNCLESIIEKEKRLFVFKCCGRTGKAIETRGLCPWCNKQNTEVVNPWKYKLAQAIHKLIMEKYEEAL